MLVWIWLVAIFVIHVVACLNKLLNQVLSHKLFGRHDAQWRQNDTIGIWYTAGDLLWNMIIVEIRLNKYGSGS